MNTRILTAVLTLAIIIGASPVSALTISPAKIETAADPGTTITGEFLVINEEKFTKTFYTSTSNFEAQGETGTPNFVESDEGLASWINVEGEITVEPGEQRVIPFTVNVPEGAESGGHFAAIFLSTLPPANSSNQVSLGAKIGILILLKVSGPVREGGGLLEFATDKGRIYTSLPVTFAYRLENSGNDRVKPSGTIAIKNTFGITTETLPANPSEGNILPSSVRKFDVSWPLNEKAPEGPQSFMSALKYQWQNFALGYYKADLDVEIGQKTDAMDTWFIVLPWQLILVTLLLLALLWFILHQYNKWIVRKSQMMNGGFPPVPPQPTETPHHEPKLRSRHLRVTRSKKSSR